MAYTYKACIEFVLAASLAVLSMQSCRGFEKENDWSKQNLKGKVKSTSTISYETSTRFRVIEKSKTEIGTTIIFNRQGNTKEYNDRWLDGTLNRWIYHYNDQGFLIEQQQHRPNGSLGSKWTFKYDDQGNMIEKNQHNPDVTLDLHWTYGVDDNGNRIEWDWYDFNGNLVEKTTYKHDSKGNIIEENNYKPDGSLFFKETHKYDDRGNAIEQKRYVDDLLNFYVTYRFNENDDFIESNYYNPDGSLRFTETNEYEYDTKGNWTKMIEPKDNGSTKITERKIEYFD